MLSILAARIMKPNFISSQSFDVVVLDDFSGGRRENLSQHFGKPSFRLVEGDVRSKADVRKVLEKIFKFEHAS